MQLADLEHIYFKHKDKFPGLSRAYACLYPYKTTCIPRSWFDTFNDIAGCMLNSVDTEATWSGSALVLKVYDSRLYQENG